MQAGENKNTLICRANSTVIINDLSGDGHESAEEVIKKKKKKGAVFHFDFNRLMPGKVAQDMHVRASALQPNVNGCLL